MMVFCRNFLLLFYAFHSYVFAQTNDTTHATFHSTLMGKPLSISQNADPTADHLGVQTQTQLQFLGKNKDLSTVSVEAIPYSSPSKDVPNIPIATTNWYIGGTQIWTGNLAFKNGALTYEGGIAPTQIPFPLFVYPLGPILLQVDAGVSFQGNVSASLIPGISIPMEDSTLSGKLQAELAASAYIEGYAKLLIVRAGIGGNINVIDGTAGIETTIFMNQTKPKLEGFGKVQLLDGSVYGFVDTTILFGRWRRILNKNFFAWNGKCYSFGVEQCQQ